MTDEVREVLRKLDAGDSSLTDDAVATAMVAASHEWEQTARQVSMQGVSGAPDWLLFERLVWDLAESFRLCLVRRKSWRAWSRTFDALAKLAEDRRFGKGRQAVVLVLGEYGAGRYQDVLCDLLDDREVRGHALMALRKGKIIDSALLSPVRQIALEERGWVRTEAKKYLKMLAVTEDHCSGEVN